MTDPSQPSPAPRRSLTSTLRRGTIAALRLARVAWHWLRPVLRTVLQVLLALLIVLEEWGWQPLADLLGRFAKYKPWAAVETAVARLPPYAALCVFVLPSALLLPLKFLALLLVARGQLVLAALLFLAAKVVATALVARLFLLTQPALMQIGWFAWLYDRVMPWKDALVERVHNSRVWRIARIWKERMRRALLRQWWQVRPKVRRLRAHLVITGRAARAMMRSLVRAARSRLAASRAR